MNEQIELSPRKRGIVINFPKLAESQLKNMINDVGLKLTVSQLKKLQTHYRRVEKRDPTLDELYFLGEYFTSRDCRGHLVSDLSTNSKAIAETYADLMEKREAVTRADEPPTVGELSELTSRYLESRGKSYPIDIKKKKQKYSGLTYETMFDHIRNAHGEEALNDLLFQMDLNHNEGGAYGRVKKWFLAEHPDYTA